MRRLPLLGLLFSTALAQGALLACDGGATTDADAGGGGGADGSDSGGSGNASGGTAPGSGGNATAGDELPGTDHYDCSAPSDTLPALALVSVADDFDTAILVTHAPNDADRLFVVEKGGIIWVVEKDGDTYTTLPTPFLDVATQLHNVGERGLLGLAFHPDYSENGLFYIHYSAAEDLADSDEGDTIIEEHQVSTDPNIAQPSGRRVLTVNQPTATNHNGGSIAFGPGGYLFIAIGDGGADSNTAQDITNSLGSILRIDPTGENAGDYQLPDDNLVSVEATAAPEIWSYGFRNPYRMNFDGCTGDLYIGDVGDTTTEEVDWIPRGTKHLNYGWPIMEGMTCRGDGTDCDTDGLTLPIAEFDREDGSAVVGGTVYRGSAIPALRGTYIYAEYGHDHRVFTLVATSDGVVGPQERSADINPDGLHNFFSIQNGGDGEIYVTSGGALLKLVAE